jgi:hypothetical protein
MAPFYPEMRRIVSNRTHTPSAAPASLGRP